MAVIKRSVIDNAGSVQKDQEILDSKYALEAKILAGSKPAVDWAAKDRSQLVGGRSHDAVALVNVALITGTLLADVLKLYKEALEAVLEISNEVK